LLGGWTQGIAAWNRRRAAGQRPADLSGLSIVAVDWRGANLSGVNLSRCNLVGIKFDDVNAAGAVMKGTNQGKTFRRTNFTGAILTGSNFNHGHGVKTTFDRANLRGAELGFATFERCRFNQADLTRSSLVKSSFAGSDFTEACLSGVEATEANFRDATLSKIVARKADFSSSSLAGADLSGADLRGVQARKASFAGASLAGADLRRADLTGADLQDADLRGARIHAACFDGANPRGVRADAGSDLGRLVASAATDQSSGHPDGRSAPHVKAHRKPPSPPPADPVLARIGRKLSGAVGPGKKRAVVLRPQRADGLPPEASKFGGEILWPAGERWPRSKRFDDSHVAVLQLNAKDVPGLRLPKGKDLFQLLWSTHHATDLGLGCEVRLRNSRSIRKQETAPPRPRTGPEYQPWECRLAPTQVDEYPPLEELSPRASARLTAAERRSYQTLRSAAFTSKLGGYPVFMQDPETPRCRRHGAMDHYLTIASGGRQRELRRWREDDTGLRILGVGAFYLFVCTRCAPWRFESVLQR
jgi:uncharacterized protein YjbI with pentapeptide repeats